MLNLLDSLSPDTLIPETHPQMMLNLLNQPLQMINLLKPLLKTAERHCDSQSTSIWTVQTLSVKPLDEWVTDHRQWKCTPKKKDKNQKKSKTVD